jgi:hypothetical protein
MTAADAMRGRPGRGGIYRYLWERYDELKAAWDERMRAPDWNALAEQMRREGVRPLRGGRVTGEAVRKAWSRVLIDAEKFGDKRKPQPTIEPMLRVSVMDEGVSVLRAGDVPKGTPSADAQPPAEPRSTFRGFRKVRIPGVDDGKT